MTPKEKAKELVIKMFEPNNHILNMNFKVDYNIAKQCALVTVEELLNSKVWYFDEKSAYVKYWEEVKQEIEKL
jgi:hypothetical protein